MTLRPLLPVTALLTLACAGLGASEDDEKTGRRDDPRGSDTTTDPTDPTDETDETDTDTTPPEPTWHDVLIDFDELDRDQSVDTLYAEALVFEVEGGNSMNSWNYEAYSESPPCTAYTSSSPGGAGSEDDFRIVFTTPVRNFSFVSLGDQTDGKYGVADVLTEDGSTGTLNLRGDGGSSTGEVQDFSEWDNIVEISIRDISDPYTVNIDDITFEQQD